MTTIGTADPAEVRAGLEHDGLVVLPDPRSVQEFEELADALITPMVHQATGTVERDAVSEDARTATVNKGFGALPLHREAWYAPGSPHILAFHCVDPADHDGETVVCDGVELLERLEDRDRAFFEANRITWSFTAPPERWHAQLGTEDEAEALLAIDAVNDMGPAYETFEGRFLEGVLHGRFTTDPLMPTRWGGGRRAFCNGILWQFYRDEADYPAKRLLTLTLEDGSPVPADVVARVRDHAEALSREIPWSPGVTAFVDNTRWMHGRRAHEDPSRRILLRMGHERAT